MSPKFLLACLCVIVPLVGCGRGNATGNKAKTAATPSPEMIARMQQQAAEQEQYSKQFAAAEAERARLEAKRASEIASAPPEPSLPPQSVGKTEAQRQAEELDEIKKTLNQHGVTLTLYSPPGGRLQFTVNQQGLIEAGALAEIERLNAYSLKLYVEQKEVWTDETLAQLARCSSISKIRLIHMEKLTDAGMEAFAHIPQLEQLELYSHPKPSNVTDVGVGQLAAISNLQNLSVFCNELQVNGSFLAAFDNHPKLATLVLIDNDGKNLSDAGLAKAGSLPHLRSLEIQAEPITGSGLHFLNTARELEFIRLQCIKLTDTGISHLESLPKLETVSVDSLSMQVTDRSLQSLGTLTNLKKLELTNLNGISNEGLAYLVPLQNLQTLRFMRCVNIGDQGMPHIAKLVNLETLGLDQCSVSDEGLESLLPLTKLKYFGAARSHISEERLAAIKEQLRNRRATPSK